MTVTSYDLLDTIDLAYGEAGSGEPLVLLHGLGSSRHDWALQLPAFVPTFRTVAIDLRGHGQSPRPSGPYRIAQMAADVALLLMRLDARPAHVVGLSLGGAVAQQLTLDYPELVRSLVLVNTASHFVTTEWRQRIFGMKRFAGAYLQPMDKVAVQVADRLFPLLEQTPLRNEAITRIAANDPKAYRACLWAIARFNATFLLELIACPTLVVAGEQDTTVPLAAKQVLAERIPNSRLLIIPNSGHATPVDQPDLFHRAVLDFLQSTA
jgi:pimeloyl-ACP methyl ester carboxylesterase